MRWHELSALMKESFDVVVEPRRSGNKYWLVQQKVYYPISTPQFDRLLEGGYIDPDYRVERDLRYGSQQLIYRGR